MDQPEKTEMPLQGLETNRDVTYVRLDPRGQKGFPENRASKDTLVLGEKWETLEAGVIITKKFFR